MVDVWASTEWRLCSEAADHLLGRAPLGVDLFQVGQRLHEEERRNVSEVEVVEPHCLVQAQRLQRRLVEDVMGPRLTSKWGR